VITFSLRDCLEELKISKGGMYLDTFDFVVRGMKSGLLVEKGLQDQIKDIDEVENVYYLNKMKLRKIDLSYNKYANPESWRKIIRLIFVLNERSLE
jgi:IS4 transposase